MGWKCGARTPAWAIDDSVNLHHLLKPLDSSVNLIVVFKEVGIKSEHCPGIIGFPFLQGRDYKPANLIVALTVEQGTFEPALYQSVEQTVIRGCEPDSGPMGEHKVHIVEETWRTTPAGYYDILKLPYLMEHPPFHVAEGVLSLGREYIAHIHMVTGLDISVKVYKIQ